MVVEARAAGGKEVTSLIVCPPTLVGHWAHEIAKFVSSTILRPLAVQGPPQVSGNAFKVRLALSFILYRSLTFVCECNA